MTDYFIEIAYIAASILFILGLKGLSSPEKALFWIRFSPKFLQIVMIFCRSAFEEMS